MASVFLHCHRRLKNGKEHRSWSITEKVRVRRGQWVQRHLLYLGEINDSQKAEWTKVIAVFDSQKEQTAELALYPAGQAVPEHAAQYGVQVRLQEFALHRSRQWGACWIGCQMWEQLELDKFWSQRLADSWEGTCWQHVLQTLVIYRWIDPGSEWRLHRPWFHDSAMADRLEEDFALAEKDTLDRCLDKILDHRTEVFRHLRRRWEDLFKVKFDVLLYDLTSTCFESDPPFGEEDKRKFGYSRDKRPDCVQIVIALVVTPEGFPLAYEVMAGNTSDKTTLRDFLKKIEDLPGKAERIRVMDRGIPTEAVLAEMRASDPPVSYLVGTPKGRLKQYESKWVEQPWKEVREGVEVKLLAESGEMYVLARSRDRVCKERAMRRRQLNGLWKRLQELGGKELKRDDLLLKLGAARNLYPSAWRLVKLEIPEGKKKEVVKDWSYTLLKDKLRQTRRREGRSLLRTNLTGEDPARLWKFYIQLTEVEAAFKDLKDDLSLRPIFHQLEKRIEAHMFVAFQAYCLHVSLRQRLRAAAPGLTPRSVLEKFSAIQMLDVHFPTTDHREMIFRRYTQPEKDHKMILAQLKWELPPQEPPRITGQGKMVEELAS